MNDTECLDFAGMLETEFLKLYYEYADGKPEMRKAHIIDSFWIELYNIIFKPTQDEIIYNRCKSRLLPYRVYDIESVLQKFIVLNNRYGGVIKIENFINLTGYNRQTFYNWNKWNKTNDYIFKISDNEFESDNNINIYVYNGKSLELTNCNRYMSDSEKELSKIRFDVLKKLREEIYSENTTSLSQTSVGQVVRANNDRDVGKLYAVDNARMQHDVKAIETAQERAQRLGITLNSD